MNKNLIIHTTEMQNKEIIKVLLLEYENYCDGWEGTCNSESNTMLSFRYYYYDIPHYKLLKMCSILFKNKDLVSTKIKIQPLNSGRDYHFD